MENKLRSFFESRWVLPLFVLIYAVIFIDLRHGAGNNWDWLTPYFSGQSSALFTRGLSSWQDSGIGSPTGFAPGAIFMIFEGLVLKAGLAPEYFIYGILVSIFSLGSYIVFRAMRHKGASLAFILALVVFINPAIFYKLLAGHLIYLVGYLFYVALVCYLLGSYKARIQDAVVVGLLFAFSGLQIQFLLFSALTIVIYFLVNLGSRKPSWKEVVLIIVLPLAVHLFWLISFFTGASSVSSLSQAAQDNSFTSLSHASPRDVGLLIFSGATFIRYFYTKHEMVFFAAFWLLLAYGAVSKRFKFDRDTLFLLICLTLFVFLATGSYQSVPIPLIKTLYPMLREAGHSAPLVVFYLALTTFYLLSEFKISRTILTVYMFIFLSISVPVYLTSVPRVNFDQARNQFSEFLPYVQAASSNSRILTYPFFSQYGFNNQLTNYKNGTPMSNSGWDSFIIFSGKPYVENAISPEDIKDSLQYKFLQSYNVDLLSSQGIKYIYNFSGIYHTNIESFADPALYSNQRIDQVDPQFFNNIIKNNPGKAVLLSRNVLEIVGSQDIINGDVSSVAKINPERYQVTVTTSGQSESINMLQSYDPHWIIVDSNNKAVPANHFLLNNQFNGWTVNTSTLPPDGKVFIIYQPQKLYAYGQVISFVSTLFACLYLFVAHLRGKNRRQI